MSISGDAVRTMLASLRRRDRRSLDRMIVVLLIGAGALIGAANYRRGRSEQRHGRGQAGKFDSYVLALSWAPAFCAQDVANRSYRECDAHRHLGFIVHGLWPQRGEGAPLEYCGTVPPVSHNIVEDMLSVMPDRSLIQHEWRAHGSCSGLSARDYFAAVKKAYLRVRVPRQFEDRSRQISSKPAEVEQLFQTAGGLGDSASIRVACRQGELTEVRICLSRNLDAIPCPANVRDCQASHVNIRPIP